MSVSVLCYLLVHNTFCFSEAVIVGTDARF